MSEVTVNVAGDKHEFDPELWTAERGQNGSASHSDLPHRHPETGIHVLVIGAGMGGLMTTLESWRKGHNVVGVLERNEGPVYSGSQSFSIHQPSELRSLPTIRRYHCDATIGCVDYSSLA